VRGRSQHPGSILPNDNTAVAVMPEPPAPETPMEVRTQFLHMIADLINESHAKGDKDKVVHYCEVLNRASGEIWALAVGEGLRRTGSTIN
jgi:hypothetical protein